MANEEKTADGTGTAPVLAVRGLSVEFTVQGRTNRTVREMNLDVRPGEIVAVVGESGSGKSLTAMSVMRLLPPTARSTGTITLGGVDVRALAEGEMRAVRGADVAMIFQEPMTALNPVFTVGWQVAEALRIHQSLSREQSRVRAADLLRRSGISDAERRLRQYPHELSGGLRQRVMIALAIANEPELLIADEATTALDVTVQSEILELLRELRDRTGMAILVITHNMGVVADIADRVVVMNNGEAVEQAPVHELFASPRAQYTRSLLASVPRLAKHTPGTRLLSDGTESGEDRRAPDERPAAAGPALELRQVVVEFGSLGTQRFRAVDEVTLSVGRGEIVGLVGESGSGKSTVGRTAIGLLAPRSGDVRILGESRAGMRRRRLRELRQRCAIIFQDPASSLDPRMTIGQSIAEPMAISGTGSRREREHRVATLLEQVSMDADAASRYPHQLSGGQRQRVGIARALALDPDVVIADEPTSALDVSIQASVLDLFLDLQARLGFACLFITHDLAVVSLLAHRVAVMRQGRIVEEGSRDAVLFASEEPYTRRLVAAAPVPDPVEQRRRRSLRLESPGDTPGVPTGSSDLEEG